MRSPSRTLPMLADYAGYSTLALYALGALRKLGRPPYALAFLKQFNAFCAQGLAAIALRAVALGVVLNAFVVKVLGGDTQAAMDILAMAVLREGGPLLVALVLLLSVGPDNTTRLGTHWNNGEAAQLHQLGLSPYDYLVVPKLLGMVCATVLLTFCFQMLSIAGGLLGGMLLLDQSPHQLADALLSQVQLHDLAYTCIKSLLFGTVIATITCYHGVTPRPLGGATIDLRGAVSLSLVRALFFVTATNALLAYVFYGVVLFGLFHAPV